jgi:serine/threonine protein kinase/TolB-like protein
MPGTKLGNFHIVGLMGLGAMGEVYRARDLKLGREVAIKIVRQSQTAAHNLVARFRREAQILASLNHPNIAAIYGLEEEDGCTFLVMELAPGPTLYERMQHGLLPPREMLDIAIQMAEALSAAHERGVVHRDLKPANLKIGPNGKVKILDFGLAKSVGLMPGDGFGHDPRASVTQEGMIVGTPAYMSPEQAAGRPVDKRTDVWSFGCVLFEMCAGQPPFVGESSLSTIAMVLEREPDWSKLPKATNPRIRELLERCLRKEPQRRLNDLGDARIELEEVAKELAKTVPALTKVLPSSADADPSATTALKPEAAEPPLFTDTRALPGVPTVAAVPSARTEAVGDTPAPAAAPVKPRTSRIVQIILFAVLALLVAVLAYTLYDLLAPREKLAVLALTVPQRSTPELQNIIKGVRDQTLTALRDSSELQRIGYQVEPAGVALGGKSPSDLGRELEARLILAGDVTMDANDGPVKIRMALIDTKLSKTLWTNTYSHENSWTDVDTPAKWQDEIARDVAKHVQGASSK